MNRSIPLTATAAFMLAMHTGVAAGTIYRWTDSDGQPYFSDHPPGGPATVLRQTTANDMSPPGRHGLRSGERRILDRLKRQAEARRETQQAFRAKARQRRAGEQQACREMRERLRDSRDHALRKHYAGELRRNCW